jgi:hypothetical protein
LRFLVEAGKRPRSLPLDWPFVALELVLPVFSSFVIETGVDRPRESGSELASVDALLGIPNFLGILAGNLLIANMPTKVEETTDPF